MTSLVCFLRITVRYFQFKEVLLIILGICLSCCQFCSDLVQIVYLLSRPIWTNKCISLLQCVLLALIILESPWLSRVTVNDLCPLRFFLRNLPILTEVILPLTSSPIICYTSLLIIFIITTNKIKSIYHPWLYNQNRVFINTSVPTIKK